MIVNEYHIIATPLDALKTAKEHALDQGYEVVLLGDRIEGEARAVAVDHARLIMDIEKKGNPTVNLSGGEVTVTLSNRHGIGGGNTEYLLALATELEGQGNIWGMACDTDGQDGSGNNTGAIFVPETMSLARGKGLNPELYLAGNDSNHFFKELNCLVLTGPTHTNVNDFRAIIVNPG
ncbi:MAG: hypothetical protein L3J50_11305 [Emcibacter sp.]|nr:hypothetical protein [Emcibacter sp.]